MSATRIENGTTCKIQRCILCDVQRGGEDSFKKMTGDSPLLSLSEISPGLSVMMDSFPVGELGGHLLIVPKKHLTSLAQYTDKQELDRVVDQTIKTLQQAFPDYWLFTFEHGAGEIDSAQVKCGGCHVDHAHGHIVLVQRNVHFDDVRDLVELTLENLGWDLEEATFESSKPFIDMANFTGSLPYLQIGIVDGNSRESVTFRQLDVDKSIPSQLMRKLLAEAAGNRGALAWNWKIALKQNVVARLNRYRDQGLSFKRNIEKATRSLALPAVA